MIRIPKIGTNGQYITFYRVVSDSRMEELSRHDFFELVRNTPNGEDHILPDFDSAIVYFIPGSEHSTEMSRHFCYEADAQRQQDNRHHDCVLKGTVKCDGWKKGAAPEQSCANCKRKHTCRTISLNATFEDDDGNEFEFGDVLPDDLSDSVEEIAQKHDERSKR